MLFIRVHTVPIFLFLDNKHSSHVCVAFCAFVQTLLRYGANTELRDEEGKLAVEKARERNSDGHKEVVAILHTPRMSRSIEL